MSEVDYESAQAGWTRVGELERERDRLRAEVERLRAEIDRLRQKLQAQEFISRTMTDGLIHAVAMKDMAQEAMDAASRGEDGK